MFNLRLDMVLDFSNKRCSVVAKRQTKKNSKEGEVMSTKVKSKGGKE